MVRDHEAGGSNPPSPTHFFKPNYEIIVLFEKEKWFLLNPFTRISGSFFSLLLFAARDMVLSFFLLFPTILI
jgi:hypothetical protein